MQTLTFEIEGLTEEQTHSYREMIHLLISNGVFNVRNGKVILNFDCDGILQEIEFNVKKYRRKRIA
jgi:hypothetical protein